MNNNNSYEAESDALPDYIRYVCSRDIREYLYEINFRITDLQAFFFIDSCTHVSYEEKLEALRYLLAKCEDFAVHNNTTDKKGSFKNLLSEVIKGREKSLADFKDNSNSNFLYAVYGRFECINRALDHFYKGLGYFSSIDAALNAPSYKDCDYIKIEKLHIGVTPEGSSCEVAVAYYSKDKVLLEIDDNYGDYASYQDFCIYLPLPFQKGDILTYTDNYRIEDHRGNYVYDSCTLKDSSNIRDSYDFSDNALLLYKNSLGYPFLDNSFNLFDCEYSRIPLEEDEQKLKNFSLFLKGVTDIGETIECFDFIDIKIRKQKLRGLVEQYIPEVIENSKITLKGNPMDYIKYVNSEAIRNHLYRTGYSLSFEQKIFVVDNSLFISLEEKMNLLEQIRKEADKKQKVIISDYTGRIEIPAAEFLNQILYRYLKLAKLFKEDSPDCYYLFEIKDEGTEPFYTQGQFSTYGDCISYKEKHLNNDTHLFAFRIRKIYLTSLIEDNLSREKSIRASFNSDFCLMDLDCCGFSEELYDISTDDLVCYLPMPFRKGDILTRKSYSCSKGSVTSEVPYSTHCVFCKGIPSDNKTTNLMDARTTQLRSVHFRKIT